ncbi:MAG: DUF302 domain-containing protein [Phormidesmis sp.]
MSKLLRKRQLGLSGAIALLALVSVFGLQPGRSLPIPTPTGLVVKQSPHSMAETESRFISTLEEKGLNVFATIDHAQNAEGAGLTLPPTRVIIFGNPQLGTPLMQCSRSIAIDLPQKLLIWEDEAGQVQIAYNDPRYLGGRHRLGECGNDVIQQIAGALDNFSDAAVMP